jgi:hypothetical protein
MKEKQYPIQERDYQPALIWAKFQRYAGIKAERAIQPHDLTLFIYLKNKSGAYFLNSSKLYWDEIVGDGYYSNCDQNSLWEDRDNIFEFVGQGFQKDRKETELIAESMEEFTEKMNLD